jgi:hypothetical protein
MVTKSNRSPSTAIRYLMSLFSRRSTYRRKLFILMLLWSAVNSGVKGRFLLDFWPRLFAVHSNDSFSF